MHHSLRTCGLTVLLLGLAVPVAAGAQGLRNYLDSIDLNQYSLGLNFQTSESKYDGIDNFTILYPVPTRFGHSLLDRDPLFVRDASIGLRKVSDNGLEVGVFGKIQTNGYGSNESDALLGMRRRGWTLQAGVVGGMRLGPLHSDLFLSTDVANEHNGYEAVLKIAWPLAGEVRYLVPQLDLRYQSADLVNHYFGVRPDEAQPGRPAYAPGAALTVTGSVEYSWQFHRRWFLTLEAAVDLLPDEVTRSPIVSTDTSWRFSGGIAYDGKAFIGPDQLGRDVGAHLEAGIGAFFMSAESNMDFLSSAAPEADLESAQALDDSPVGVPVELTWRIGRFHRFDLSYFRLHRSSTAELAADLAVANAIFPAGATVATDFDTRVLRFGYGFALFRDDQKELSVFGGLHVTDIDYRVRDAAQSIAASTTAFLPVIGAHFSAAPTERLSVGVSLEIFELDFDQHGGELIDFFVSAQYRLTERVRVGAGYRFYRQDIDSGDASFLGDYRLQYRGPAAFLRLRF